MKLNDKDLQQLANEVKFGDLPSLEKEFEISITELRKSLPFTRGLQKIDNNFGLVGENMFVIIAGEGGSGKTTYTMQQALCNANNGVKVCYMSLEMGRKRLIISTARKKSGVAMQTQVGVAPTITPQQEITFKKEVEKLQSNKNLNIIGYEETLSVETFKNEIDRLATQYDMIFIDNLGLIGRGGKETEILPMITQHLMKVRNKTPVTIIALHHMSKGTEKQTGERGKNAIRGSGKLLDDADKIATIARTESGTSLVLVKDREEGVNIKVELFFSKGEFVGDIF